MMKDDRNIVQSVAKAFSVLRAFDVGHAELTVSDVAKAAGLDRGTAFRLIHTLVALGYLAEVPNSKRYWLTLKCLELGHSALQGAGLPGLSRPQLQMLVPSYGDAASLGALEGADVIYLERIQGDLGRHPPERRAGSRTGAYAAALGHAILAFLPTEAASTILDSSTLVALSDRTLTDKRQIMARLEEVRHQGFAVSDGENAYGLRTVAAPLFWPNGSVRAAISLTIKSERQGLQDFVSSAVPKLLSTAKTITDGACMA